MGRERFARNDITGEFQRKRLDEILKGYELEAFDVAVSKSFAAKVSDLRAGQILSPILGDATNVIVSYTAPFPTPSAIAFKAAVSVAAEIFYGMAEDLCSCYTAQLTDELFSSDFVIDDRFRAKDGLALRLLLRVSM